jgi:hypothetical protein
MLTAILGLGALLSCKYIYKLCHLILTYFTMIFIILLQLLIPKLKSKLNIKSELNKLTKTLVNLKD